MSADFAEMSVNGRMTNDPKQLNAGENTKVVFSVAVNRNFKRGDEWEKKTTFIDCVAWGGAATHVLEHGKKGVKVTLTGSFEEERYTPEGKDEVVRKNVNVRNISVFSAKEDEGTLAPAKTSAKKATSKKSSDEDVPF